MKIRGWYRRKITPYIELYDMEWDGDKKKTMRTRPWLLGLTLALGIFGIFLQLTLPLAFLVLGVFLLVFVLFLKWANWRFEMDTLKRVGSGPHPYRYHSSISDSVMCYGLISFCDPVKGDVFPEDDDNPREVTISVEVRCPYCNTVQRADLTSPESTHVCSGCGIETKVDLAGLRI